jgi:cytochrome c-type biogenesis protein
VTGLDIATLEEGRSGHTRRIVATTGLFIAGFGTVYVLLGLTAASIGQPLRDHQVALTRISGAIMLAMALFLIGSFFLRAPWQYQE